MSNSAFVKYILALVSLFAMFGANAQSRYISGFLVKNSGDSLRGYIFSRNLKTAPIACRFKEGKRSEVKDFQPIEIRSFGSDSALVESAKEFDRRELKPKAREFYRILFDGKLDILVNKSNRYYIRTDTSEFVYNLNKKDMLYYLTSDQPELKKEIKLMKFSDNNFARLLTTYHNNLNLSDYKLYLPPSISASLDFFLLMGYNLSTLKSLNGSEGSYTFSNSYAPLFGYGVDYFPSVRARSSNFSINLQNRFTKELFQHQSTVSYNNAATYIDILYEAFVIQVPVGLKYHRRLNSKFKFYVMPGLLYQKNIPKESRMITDTITGDEAFTQWDDLDYYSKSMATVFVSLGVERRISNKSKIFVDIYTDISGTNLYKRSAFTASVGYKMLNFRFDD